jgi:hypothetical protein
MSQQIEVGSLSLVNANVAWGGSVSVDKYMPRPQGCTGAYAVGNYEISGGGIDPIVLTYSVGGQTVWQYFDGSGSGQINVQLTCDYLDATHELKAETGLFSSYTVTAKIDVYAEVPSYPTPTPTYPPPPSGGGGGGSALPAVALAVGAGAAAAVAYVLFRRRR